MQESGARFLSTDYCLLTPKILGCFLCLFVAKLLRGAKAMRKEKFQTLSGFPLKPFYTSDDTKEFDQGEALGNPGQYPFTRGV